MAPDRGVLLVLGPVPHAVQDNLLHGAAQELPVVLLNDQLPTWERAHIAGHMRCDVHDDRALAEAVTTFRSRFPIAGITTWNEECTHAAAAVARRLGLPGPSPKSVGRSLDRSLSAAALVAAGVPCRASVHTGGVEFARTAAARFGYPVLVERVGSVDGPVRADNEEQLLRTWAFLASAPDDTPGTDRRVLVSQCLEGEVVTVDVAVRSKAGAVAAIALTRHRTVDVGRARCMELSVSADDPLLEDLAPLAVRAVWALGLRRTLCSVDLVLTGRGPKILRVTSRVAAGLGPYLVFLATGVSLGRESAAVACGSGARTAGGAASGAAAARIFRPGSEPLVRGGERRVPIGMPWLRRYLLLGDPAGPQESRRSATATEQAEGLSFAVVVADSLEQARDRLAVAAARMVA
ncbi:acetyl-CoA carboxylase biotin carboxylase subunit family protein [Kitasatospora sp. NPDC088783]|uniref:ATP-grasp domain-containing protein n=1 Tax=Kitasatospora sp. NPDC088783 TaxID=3364077 RepID=UPI0038268B0E